MVRILLRPVCILEGWLYTIRYWFRGGVLQFSVAGHTYVDGGSYKAERNGQAALVQEFVCERCGHISEGWKPW